MTQVEVSAAAASLPGQAITGTLGVNTMFTPERIQELLDGLSEPFDAEVVEWRVTNTSGKRGQVVAYADQRAYTDRLNELFTPLGWTRKYAVQTVQNFEVPRKGDAKNTIITAKVMVTAEVTIFGLGTHSGTGEEWAIDENALTRAEAQAFKRACSCFGLGRYFYDLPRTWVDVDEHKRPLALPKLPEWALSKTRRSTSGQRRSGRQEPDPSQRGGNGTNGGSANSPPARSPATGRSRNRGNERRGDSVYGSELRKALGDLAEEVGFSLTRSVVQAVAGKDEIAAVQNNAHLTSVMERLTDLARGVQRLKAATEKAGTGVYAGVCRQLNLASDSIDDIPSREVLRELVNRMEAAATAGATGTSSPSPKGSNGTAGNGSAIPTSSGASGTGIAQLRDRLLLEARRVARAQRKGIGDVIAAVTHGSFGFAELTKLTDADVGKVEAALAELARMTG
jgi:hypothetical protein